VPGLGSGSFPLVSVSAAGASDQAIADRDVTPGDTGSGTVSRALGTVSVLGLPSGVAGPAGWGGSLLTLSGFSASASASAGPGAGAAATAATETGTVSYWNGSGYTALPLAATGASVPVAPVLVSSGSCAIAITGTVSTGGWTATSTGLGGGGIATAAADVPAPLAGTFTVRVSCPAVVVADMTIALDLGDTSAQAAYS
jgi:hypothetical protein